MQNPKGSAQTPAEPNTPALRMPRLSAEQVLGILRESGVPEHEARRRIASDPTWSDELSAIPG